MKIAKSVKSKVAGFSLTMMIVSMFTVGVAQAATFTDVKTADWFYSYVEQLADDNIIDSTKGMYRPLDNVNRAEMAKLAVEAFDLTIETPATPTFKDVPKMINGANYWAYPYIETAYKNGVIGGYSNSSNVATGYYGPNDSLTREQAMKIIVNAASLEIVTAGGPHFPDVPVKLANGSANWSYEFIETGYHWSIVDGNKDGTFAPRRNVLRSEIAKMIANGMISPPVARAATPPPVVAGDLTVSLDGSSPDSVNIPKNGANIPFSVFNLKASSNEDVRVEEVVITRKGLGLASDFDNVKLYVDGVQLGSEKTINTSTNTATFSIAGSPVVVPAGKSVLVEVRGDMSGEENSENSLCISTATDVSAFGEASDAEVTVGGSFDVCGELMTTTSASVGTITYEVDDYTGDINVGDTNVSLARVKLDVSSVEDVDVTRVSFKQKGSADTEDFANEKLYISGTALDAEGVWEGDFLTFDLSDAPVFIERGNSRTLELRSDVVGGLGNTAEFDIYRDWHIEGTGRVYHYGVNVVEALLPPNIAPRDIIGGNLALSLSAGNPTVGDIAAGAEDKPLMAFNLSTGGDGIEILAFDLDIDYAGAWADEDELQDVKVWTKNSSGVLVVVAGPLDPATGCGGPCTLSFNDSFLQNAGLTKEYIVTADVDNNAPDGAIYAIDFDTSTIDAEYLSNGDAVAAADISGGILNGKDQTVADPTLDVTLAVLPTDQNIVGGKIDMDAAAWNFAASSASDLKVTSVTITCDYTDTSADGDVCEDVWTNGRLYYVEGSTYTLLQGGKSFSGGTVVFNTVNHLIPAGDTHKLVLRANTSTAADDTDFTEFDINAVGDFVAEDEQFNTLAAAQKSTDSNPRTVDFIGAGTLTVSLSGSTPTDDAMVGGKSGVEATVIKLVADENEDIIVKKLRLANWGDDSAVGSVKLYDGAALLATSTFSGNNASFTNLNIIVPADGQKLLKAVIDSNLVGSSAATSGDNVQIAMDFVDDANTFESELNDIKAVGASSGEDVNLVDGITASDPGTFTVYNTLPTLTRTAASPTSGGGTNVPMLEFKVDVAGKTGDSGTITRLELGVDGTCAVPPASFRLYRGGTEVGDSGANLELTAAEFNNTIGEEIESGTSSTLKVQVDTTGCADDETLVVTVTEFDYDDGSGVADYLPTDANNYLFFDSAPFPMAGHQFKF